MCVCAFSLPKTVLYILVSSVVFHGSGLLQLENQQTLSATMSIFFSQLHQPPSSWTVSKLSYLNSELSTVRLQAYCTCEIMPGTFG